jgi:hypothetical protein
MKYPIILTGDLAKTAELVTLPDGANIAASSETMLHRRRSAEEAMGATDRPTVFISYRRGHEASLAIVARLEAALADGFQVLRDVNLEPGGRWSDELWQWLMGCSGAIAVISNEAAESDWCRREWSVMAARESLAHLRVVPVHVGEVGPKANILNHLQAVVDGPHAVEAVVARLRGLQTADRCTGGTCALTELSIHSRSV